jgi:hypothetical protein
VNERLIKNEYFCVKKAIGKKIEARVAVRIQTLFAVRVRELGVTVMAGNGRKGVEAVSREHRARSRKSVPLVHCSLLTHHCSLIKVHFDFHKAPRDRPTQSRPIQGAPSAFREVRPKAASAAPQL